MSILFSISTYSILLPSGMVFLGLRKSDPSINLIRILVLTTLILDSINVYYVSDYCVVQGLKNNMFLFHIFTFLEAILLILYFREFFQQTWIRKVLLTLSGAFSFLVFLNVILWESLDQYPSITRSLECILIMILSIIFFVYLFQKSEVLNLIMYPHFWLVSGLLLFFAGTFFMNIVGSLVINQNELDFNVYHIHSFLNIFLNIIYTIALWMSSRRLISAQ